MKTLKKVLTAVAAVAIGVSAAMATPTHYVGGDISLLPTYEGAGAKYLDHNGWQIPSLLPWLKQQGMNAQRVRLFVNPKKYAELHKNDSNPDTRYDTNACQDLDYILPLCQDIVNSGMDLMLDFHYSDTWADPVKQWTPVDWEGLTDEQLYEKIYAYTRETLETLKAAGVTPAFIQPGNEISYGMLWGKAGTASPKKTLMGSDANWQRFGKLLSQAIKACREVCPDAKIIIHTERVTKTDVQQNFYDWMKRLDIDYDIIGLSYYPYWHNGLDVLKRALSALVSRYPEKDIMIVETGYAYKWQVPGTEFDHTSIWPLTDAGQAAYARDLVSTCEEFEAVTGIFWWWMEYNAYGTKLEGWYNAPLFDSTTGRAGAALQALCRFNYTNSGIIDIESGVRPADDSWYDLQGRRITRPTRPGIYINSGRKVIIR